MNEKEFLTAEQIKETIRDCLDQSLSIGVSKWLKINEACKYAKMSKNTMMRYISDADIYATKKGGVWIVDRDSIDSFYDDDRRKIFEFKRKLGL